LSHLKIRWFSCSFSDELQNKIEIELF